MFSRSISKREVVLVLESGKDVAEYPDDHPFPSKLILGFVENRPIHVVVAYDKNEKTCILITAYVPDLEIWDSDYKKRRKS
jgi:hypothetical protein